MRTDETPRLESHLTLLGILIRAAFPWLAERLGLDYYVGFVMRVIILALVVSSLNFLMGYGGLPALGHAGFIGVGSYTMVALVEAGVESVALLWLGAIAVSIIAAFFIGLIVLRTRGIYYLMITLAFAEMIYYIAVSLSMYGGDDGYILSAPVSLGLGYTPSDTGVLYRVVLAVVVLGLAFLKHITGSRFGQAVVGIRDNETRMQALGYPTFWLRLQTFVIASAIAGLGGAMMMTQNGFISLTTIHWTHSAELMVIVALGGMGSKWGPIVGVVLWSLLKEFLPQLTEYWHWPMGLLVIIIILVAPNGLSSLFGRNRQRIGKIGLPMFIRRFT